MGCSASLLRQIWCEVFQKFRCRSFCADNFDFHFMRSRIALYIPNHIRTRINSRTSIIPVPSHSTSTVRLQVCRCRPKVHEDPPARSDSLTEQTPTIRYRTPLELMIQPQLFMSINSGMSLKRDIHWPLNYKLKFEIFTNAMEKVATAI